MAITTYLLQRIKISAGTVRRSGARFLALLLMLGMCACSEKVSLQSGLNDADANEIVMLLNRQGMDAQKLSGKAGVTVMIKDGDISRATAAMQAAGLPKRSLAQLGDVFKKEGMISTPLEERIRYIHGLSQELEYTLQQFDNVVTARVHVVLPERVAPGEPIQPSSAAVFIKHREPFDEDMLLPRIRNLVASSIPGLSGEDGRAKVSVVLIPAEPAAAGVEWQMVGPFQVVADSAPALRNLIAGLASLALLSLLLVLALLLLRKRKIANWIVARMPKLAFLVHP
ncbi:type III secretion protein J [Collimonas sp. PA-H2]|uniref:type III secretion system inner membrane ring lipoprotein SctJ n=1 Tax=Collimonas sp. PA-H2 TaxID=1881062 RepID=UPI000BF4D77B|nr:type III secretion inner membrane ring lipoprotein SctJ [Collimonas sp. PA-H2]PFH10296.1 type III secretion protein J [Collimonas sp. PA-H2]